MIHKVDPTTGKPLPTEVEIHYALQRLINSKKRKSYNTATELEEALQPNKETEQE